MLQGKNISLYNLFSTVLTCLLILSCSSSQKENDKNYYIKEKISGRSTLAIVVQKENSFENAILLEFLNAGYKVKAINANEFNSPDDLYDDASLAELDEVPFTKASAIASQLNFYKHEVSKIEAIKRLEKNGIDYIVLIELTEWKNGYSWVRAIDTAEQELIYLHNFKLGKNDTVQTVIPRIISQMKQGP
jgi:hypothetical protein